jgi:hypothetical protein
MEAAPEGPESDWLEQSTDLIYIFSFIMKFSSAFFFTDVVKATRPNDRGRFSSGAPF